MANKEFYDWSVFTAAENGLDLLGNAIRKSLSSDAFAGKTRFQVRALTEMKPLSSWAARSLNNSATSAGRGEVQAFRGRILGENSPHVFLPDPCDPTKGDTDQNTAWQIISMHTLFLASEQTVKTHVSRGDIVYVELEKSNNSYNLEYGTFLTLASVEKPPEPPASCVSLQNLPVGGAVSMKNSNCAGLAGDDLAKCKEIAADMKKWGAQLSASRAEMAAANQSLDQLANILDIAALAGLTGGGEIIATPATVISLSLNLQRGKHFDALIDIVGLIPVAGKTVKAGKVTVKATKWAAKYAEANKTAIKAYNAGDTAFDVVQGAAGIEKEMEGAEFFYEALNYKSEDGSYYVDSVIDAIGMVHQPAEVAALRELVKEIRG